MYVPGITEREVALGRWLDDHYDQVLTALIGTRDLWSQSATSDDATLAAISLRETERWSMLAYDLTAIYEGDDHDD